jgi:hypothetical protein
VSGGRTHVGGRRRQALWQRHSMVARSFVRFPARVRVAVSIISSTSTYRAFVNLTPAAVTARALACSLLSSSTTGVVLLIH